MSKNAPEYFGLPAFTVFTAEQSKVEVECIIRPIGLTEASESTEIVYKGVYGEVLVGEYPSIEEAIGACEVLATGFAFLGFKTDFVKEPDNGTL